MSFYPYIGYPYNNYPYIGYSYNGYPYYGLFNDYKINGLLNEYDELNKLAIENQEIYIQNMLDNYNDCNDCKRDINGNIIPCVLPPMDLSRNNISGEYNNQYQFPTPLHLYPPYHHPPFHHQPFHYPPYHHPPYHHPPYHHPPFHHQPIHHQPFHHPPFHHQPYHHPPFQPYNRELNNEETFFDQH